MLILIKFVWLLYYNTVCENYNPLKNKQAPKKRGYLFIKAANNGSWDSEPRRTLRVLLQFPLGGLDNRRFAKSETKQTCATIFVDFFVVCGKTYKKATP